MARSDYAYNEHLKELHSSEFEMATGEPDIRNWKVIGLQNQEVGKVEELLFSDVSHRVRYLVVNINGKPLNIISRSVLIPVGLVDLLRDEKIVLLKGINVGHLVTLPVYEKGKISRETELAIRDVFSPGYAGIYEGRELTDDEEFYNHESFNNERFAHPRMEVAEKKSVKEEMKENLERVKETVRKMEGDVEKLGRSGT
jgi:hypothetical protein